MTHPAAPDYDDPAARHRLVERLAPLATASARVVERGAALFRQGDAVGDVFLLHSGIVRLAYLLPDGKAAVKSFVASPGLVGPSAGLAPESGAAYGAECVERASVTPVPLAAVRTACDRDPALMAALFAFVQWLYARKERREYEFLALPAAERYRLFLAREPELAARLTQADIARYLGITPVALSRLRAGMRAADPAAPPA